MSLRYCRFETGSTGLPGHCSSPTQPEFPIRMLHIRKVNICRTILFADFINARLSKNSYTRPIVHPAFVTISKQSNDQAKRKCKTEQQKKGKPSLTCPPIMIDSAITYYARSTFYTFSRFRMDMDRSDIFSLFPLSQDH